MVDLMRRAQRLSQYKDEDLTEEEQGIKRKYLAGTYKAIQDKTESYDDPSEIRQATAPKRGTSWTEKLRGAFTGRNTARTIKQTLKPYAARKKAYAARKNYDYTRPPTLYNAGGNTGFRNPLDNVLPPTPRTIRKGKKQKTGLDYIGEMALK